MDNITICNVLAIVLVLYVYIQLYTIPTGWPHRGKACIPIP